MALDTLQKLDDIKDIIYGEWLVKQDYDYILLLNKIRNRGTKGDLE